MSMIDLRTFLQCESCYNKELINDNALKIVYDKLVKDLLNIYIDMSNCCCKTIEEYQHMCIRSQDICNTLEFLIETDRKQI